MPKEKRSLLWNFFSYVGKSQIVLLVRILRTVLDPLRTYRIFISCCMGVRVFSSNMHERPPQEGIGKGCRSECEAGEDTMWYGKYYPRSVDKRFIKEELSLVLTDIIRSTTLWNLAPENMFKAVEAHDLIARSLCDKHGGLEVRNEGDSFFLVFEDSLSAVKFSAEFFERVSEIALITERQGATREIPLDIRIVVAEGPVMLNCYGSFCVQGEVVKRLYGLLPNACPNSICVCSSLGPVIAPLARKHPFCLHDM
jgi:hypothetical protein